LFDADLERDLEVARIFLLLVSPAPASFLLGVLEREDLSVAGVWLSRGVRGLLGVREDFFKKIPPSVTELWFSAAPRLVAGVWERPRCPTSSEERDGVSEYQGYQHWLSGPS
jgi:hypothetical protein